MSLFEDIKAGLNEAISYEQGNLENAKVEKVSRIVAPLAEFTPSQIKEIRNNSKMTQEIFAKCIGVSKKSVEAWEGGRTKPDGAARRLLGLLRDNPYFANEIGIVFLTV